MKKYRIEYFIPDLQIWETVDEIAEIEASSGSEAVEFAKIWWVEFPDGDEEGIKIAKKQVEEFGWRALEEVFDEDGFFDDYKIVAEE